MRLLLFNYGLIVVLIVGSLACIVNYPLELPTNVITTR